MPPRRRSLTFHGSRSTRSERFAVSLQHIAYLLCHRPKRLAPTEAMMMERRQQGRQLELLVREKGAIGHQRLDQASRSEITNLLKLLLSECAARAAKAAEAKDE
jgi:hypothetical protein